MADKEEGQASARQGADWEVVSLTASAYAAAPDVDIPEFKGKEKGDVVDGEKVETSTALFMSGHFVLPPNQHENLQIASENAEILGEQVAEDDDSESVEQLGGVPDAKEEGNWDLKKLTGSDDFQGLPFSDEKGNKLGFSDAAFSESTTLPGLNLAGKEQSIYTNLHLLQSEATMGGLNIDDEIRVLDETPALGANTANLPRQTEEDNHDESGLPYAAWWKKQAASLYAHAKETNTFWSIFVAAAVMGLVILGQQWQQERWQVLHHDWKSGIDDESVGRTAGPISQFKDAIIGSNRKDLFISARASGEN